MRIWLWVALAVITLASPVLAQHARGYSQPGVLGTSMQGPDTTPPEIVITKPENISTRDGVRGLKIVPEASGDVIVIGKVRDDRQVANLQINGHDIQLWGRPSERRFGLKLKAPGEGKVLRLRFVARDQAGNETVENYEIATPRFETVTDAQSRITMARDFAASPEAARYWALVVAVGEYAHPSVADLDYPLNDAREMAEVLIGNYTFERERVRVLENPSRAELITALADFAPSGGTPLNESDNLLVFYAGHGFFDDDYNEGYWLPTDAERGNRANWVSNSDVQRAFRAMKARHILLLSDACFSGSMFATRAPFSVAIQEAYKERSRKAITAGNLTRVPDHSVFKEYVVKRLVENPSDFLDAGTLYSSIKAPVTNNSPLKQRPLYGVIQQTGDEGGEFIFVRRKR